MIADEDAREEEVGRFFRTSHTMEEGVQHIKDMLEHPDRYPPGRTKFLEDMAALPGVFVPGGSYCNVVERSKSTCGRTPVETSTYLLIQVTTGRARGQQGWVCESRVQQQFP